MLFRRRWNVLYVEVLKGVEREKKFLHSGLETRFDYSHLSEKKMTNVI